MNERALARFLRNINTNNHINGKMLKKATICFSLLISMTGNAKDFSFKEGDIVFRSGRNYPVMYISSSTITHCGIVVRTPSGLQVLEAGGRVRLTPIDQFFGKKIDKAGKYTRRVSEKDLHVNYAKYLNVKYDNAFSLENDTYYCSELVYLIYKEQFGIELFEPKPLRKYNTFGLRWILRKRGISLDNKVVTPADLYSKRRVRHTFAVSEPSSWQTPLQRSGSATLRRIEYRFRGRLISGQ